MSAWARFRNRPPTTVAVREDGVSLVVPGPVGDLNALDGPQSPEFLGPDQQPLGMVEVQGVTDTPMTCSLFAISNLSSVRGAAYLALWYLASHTSAQAIEVGSVNPTTLGPLLERLGMRWIPGTRNMTGDTAAIRRAAQRKCERHNWQLRPAGAV